MVNTIDQYASKLELKVTLSEQQNARLLAITDHVMRRVVPNHLIDKVWSTTSGELIQHEEVELHNMLLIALSLQFIHNCQVDDPVIAAEIMSLLNTFANMVDDELVGDNNMIRLEQFSHVVIIGTVNVGCLTWLATLSLRFVDKVLYIFIISFEITTRDLL
jgi:hypothetical protein